MTGSVTGIRRRRGVAGRRETPHLPLDRDFYGQTLFIFLRDIDYLWGVFLQLLMYGSAIFYKIDNFPPNMQMVFACNPVYRHIAYFREIVLGGTVPSWETHLALAGFAAVALLAGMFMYKRYNTRFLYYV